MTPLLLMLLLYFCLVFWQTIVRTLASNSQHKNLLCEKQKNLLYGGGETSSAAGWFCCHSGGIHKKKEKKSGWKMFLTKPKTLSTAPNPIFPLWGRQTASQCAAARVISRTMLRNAPTAPTMQHTGSRATAKRKKRGRIQGARTRTVTTTKCCQ